MSSDEIDIEEHDVLDDPRLRHLLPDLARVKTEAPDYDDGAHELGYEPFTSNFTVDSAQTVRNGQDHSATEYTQHQNKIILGSKPSANPGTAHNSSRETDNSESVLMFGKTVRIKQEIEDLVEKPRSRSDIVPDNRSRKTVSREHASRSRKGDNSNEDVDMDQEDDDQVNSEQIPENCRVSLQDWGPRLRRSPCYCRECKILFATRNALDAHKMACHSFLVAVDNNRAVKSTSRLLEQNLKSCAQCNKKFPNDSLLLAHVYGHLEAKMSGKNKEKDLPKPSVQAKFSNKISLGSKPSSDISFADDSDDSSDDLESGFYRCSVCSYYSKSLSRFQTHNTRNHFIMNPKATRVEYDRNCRFCSYRNNNVLLYNHHIYTQHVNLYTQKAEKTQSKIRPVTTESLSVKFQCMKCGLVLQNYKQAINHRKTKHPELKSESLIKKIITRCGPAKAQNPPQATPTTIKRKADNPSVSPKRPKLDPSKIVVYYCDICKSTLLGKQYFSLHLDRKCVEFSTVKKLICAICGLQHSVNSKHAAFHDRNPDKTIHDCQFVRVQDLALVNAPIPEYPSCKRCGVCVLRPIDLQKHECGAHYKTCRYCKKTFTDDLYAAHVEFHKYIKPETPREQMSAASTPEVNEIMKKYEMLTETWNILYLCGICNIVTDSYDKAVEHSQNHFNNLENYDVTIKQCQICRLMFEESCLERHMDIHKENKSINKESFRVLNYDYSKLLTKDWFELFGNLPDSQIQQIVSRSIYAYCRSVKMTVFLEGAPELTLYQCRTCRMYVYPPSVPRHKPLVCLRNVARNFCNLCNIPFCSPTGRDAHMATHKSRGIYRHVIFNVPEDADFNAALKSHDEEVPKEIITEMMKKKKIFKDTAKTTATFSTYETSRNKNKLYNCYMCSKCKVHLIRKDAVNSHNCSTRKNVLIRCKICALKVYCSTFKYHKMKHDTDKRFIRKNMRIVKFTSQDGKVEFEEISDKTPEAHREIIDEKIPNLIKCRCGLHFTTKKTYDKHSSVCSPKLKIAKKVCRQCGYIFDALELFRHKSMHHKYHNNDKPIDIVARRAEPNTDTNDSDVESNDGDGLDGLDTNDDDNNDQCENDDGESAKHKLYRCGSCNLLFHAKVDIVRHLSVCDPEANKENKCIKCGLAFYSTVLTHMLKVSNCDQLTEDDYDIVTLFPRETTAGVDVDEQGPVYAKRANWVYKCWKCDIHWMSATAVNWYHYRNKHAITHKVIKCKICGLNFTPSSLKVHLEKHHEELKLTREDLYIQIVPGGGNVKAAARTMMNKINNKISHLIKNRANGGKAFNRLYKCHGCKVLFVSSSSRFKHLSKNRCGQVEGETCKKCGLVFNSEIALSFHITVHHKRLNMNRGDYIIQDYKGAVHKNKINMIKKKIKTKNGIKLYFCRMCPIKFISKSALKSHLHNDRHNQKGIQCSICCYSFTATSIERHVSLHHQMMKLRRKDFVLTTHDRQMEVDDENISEDTNDKDESMNESESTTSDRKSQIAKPSAKTIYKCVICAIHFVSPLALRSHIRRGVHNKRKGEKCRICGLYFIKISLQKHMYIHHKKLKLQRKDLHVCIDFAVGRASIGDVEEDNNTNTSEESAEEFRTVQTTSKFKHAPSELVGNSWTSRLSGASAEEMTKTPRQIKSYNLSDGFKAILDTRQHDNKLFKCDHCGKHYMNTKTLWNHYPCSGINTGNVDKCSLCGLTFGIRTLARHLYIHHELLNLQFEDLDIKVIKDTSNVKAAPPNKIILTKNNKGPKPSPEKNVGQSLSDAVKAELDDKNYGNDLYKCQKCGLHFINKTTKATHVCCNNPEQKSSACPDCGLSFTSSTLGRHYYVHHERLHLELEDFNIISNAQLPELPVTDQFSRKPMSSYTLSEAAKADINLKFYSNKLYKCVRCGGHFLTLASRKTHETRCSDRSAASVLDCSICGLAFFAVSLAKHMYIHHEKLNLEFEDFDIINNNMQTPKVSTNSYEFDGAYPSKNITRVRDKASETSLDRTSAKSLRKRTFDDVSENSFDLSRTSSSQNLFVGSELDSSRNDDDGTASPLSTSVLNKYPEKNVGQSLSDAVKAELDDKNYGNDLYKCQKCGLHFINKTTKATHVCGNNPEQKSSACPDCGLSFTSSTLGRHYYVHHERLHLELEDFNIISNAQLPELPVTDQFSRKPRSSYTLSEAAKADINLKFYSNKLYKCVRCGGHFLTLASRKNHEKSCSDRSAASVLDCSICGLAFFAVSLAKHMYIHHEKLNLEFEDFDIINNMQTPKVSTNSYEFDGAYPSKNITRVRDNASETSLDRTSAKSLRKRTFDDVSENSFDLSRTSSSQNLFVGSELDSSRNDDDGTASPLSTSVLNKYKKFHVSLKVLKSLNVSHYDNTLYHCTVCGVYFMVRDTLSRHIDESRHTYQLVDCSKCPYKFSQAVLPRHDYIHHGKLQLSKDDFQIVTDVEMQRTLNKCVSCNAHYFSQKHKCVRELQKCIICDLMFTGKSLTAHYERHHRKLKLSSDEFIIVEQDPNSDKTTEMIDDKDIAETGSITIEPSTSKENLDVSTDKLEVEDPNEVEEVMLVTNITPIKPKETSNETPQKELGLQHISDEPSDLEMSTLNPDLYDNKLFKCNKCSQHFLAKENFECHMRNSDHISVRKVHCTICNLAFNAQTLATHTFVHHERLKLGVDDFIIMDSTPDKEVNLDNESVVSQSSDESTEEKTVDPPENVPEIVEKICSSNEVFATKKYTTKLYKCSECNVHFLSQATCYRHTNKNHTPLDPFDYIACKICGLDFGNMILPKHVTQHHKNNINKFNLDQVLVEAYTPCKEGTPSIEIYLAIDRVQSKLVSTTTEKDAPVSSTSLDKKDVIEIPESTTSTENEETNTEKRAATPVTEDEEVIEETTNTNTSEEELESTVNTTDTAVKEVHNNTDSIESTEVHSQTLSQNECTDDTRVANAETMNENVEKTVVKEEILEIEKTEDITSVAAEMPHKNDVAGLSG